GLMVAYTSQNGCALGWDEVQLPSPLFEGDTLYADSEVLDTRASRSRSGWGIVKVRQRGFKPDGTVVLVMVRSFMVPTRAAAPRREAPSPRDRDGLLERPGSRADPRRREEAERRLRRPVSAAGRSQAR